jgi:hypothetical protein
VPGIPWTNETHFLFLRSMAGITLNIAVIDPMALHEISISLTHKAQPHNLALSDFAM